MHDKRLPYEKLALQPGFGIQKLQQSPSILFFHFQRLDALVYSPHSKSRGWVTEVNIGTTNPQCHGKGIGGGGDRKPKSAVKTAEQ